MTRVLHVITGLPVGGAQMMLYKLLSQTDRSEFEPEVVSLLDEGVMGERISALGIRVRALGMKSIPSAGAGTVRLARWIREDRSTIIQTWMYHADLFGGLAARLAGNRRIAWGIRQSNLDPRGAKRSTRWIARICAQLSRSVPARIVCCSEASRRTHGALGYDISRMVVIPNGFDLQVHRPDPAARREVRRELGLADSVILVGSMGRFHPQKDHRTLLRAASQAFREREDVHVLLCGESMSPTNALLQGWIDEGGLGSRCHLLGLRQDVARLTAALDVACSSSAFAEGFPNAIGETMACEVPCVVTDVGDSAEIVGPTGIAVPREDPEALAHALGDLINLGPHDRRELGRAARRRIGQRYELRNIATRYEAMFRELVVTRGAS